jgi:hypothetical protein
MSGSSARMFQSLVPGGTGASNSISEPDLTPAPPAPRYAPPRLMRMFSAQTGGKWGHPVEATFRTTRGSYYRYGPS